MPDPTLYYWEERKHRKATLIFDSGYRNNGDALGFIYVYELDRSRPATELGDELTKLGEPNLKWRLTRS